MARVAMVTGASRGIGRCAALDLARRGFDVAITARTVREGEGRSQASSVLDERGAMPIPGSLETTAKEIEALGRQALMVKMDMLDRVSVGMALATVIERWGHVDVLVNNAIYQGPGTMDRLLDVPIDLAVKMMEGDYFNQLALIQKALPVMLEQDPWDGAGTRGVIVNMSSAVALMDPRGPVGEGGWGVAYAAAKAAFTRVAPLIHVEFGPQGIRAYNVDPGHIQTATMRVRSGQSPEGPTEITNVSPEIPGAVIGWLASDDADAVALAGQVVKAHRVCKEHRLVEGWPPE